MLNNFKERERERDSKCFTEKASPADRASGRHSAIYRWAGRYLEIKETTSSSKVAQPVSDMKRGPEMTAISFSLFITAVPAEGSRELFCKKKFPVKTRLDKKCFMIEKLPD